MNKRKIKCYLCGKAAIQKKDYDTSGNIMINCPNCSWYFITDRAMRFFFKSNAAEERLNDQYKEKLCRYVQKKYKQTNEPVRIDTDTIKDKTGKRLVHEKY